MVSQEQLEGSGITRKGDPNSQAPAPPSTMVAKGTKCYHRPTITPNKACSANLYRRIKRRVGRSLRRAHCKRNLVPSGKQAAYGLSRAQSSLSSLKRISGPLCRQDSSCSNQQHHSGVLHKQGSMHEIGPTLCPTMENPDLAHQETGDSESLTHSRPTECGSKLSRLGQTIRTVVSPSRGFSNNMQQVALPSNRPIRHEVQHVASVCVTGTGSPGHSSGCTQSPLGESGRIRFPTSSHIWQSGGEVAGLSMQKNNSDCSGLAQHALVLGFSDHIQPNPIESAQSAQPIDTALQSDPSQKSDKSKSLCMAPRVSAIKEQGFSEVVAARIEAPPYVPISGQVSHC